MSVGIESESSLPCAVSVRVHPYLCHFSSRPPTNLSVVCWLSRPWLAQTFIPPLVDSKASSLALDLGSPNASATKASPKGIVPRLLSANEPHEIKQPQGHAQPAVEDTVGECAPRRWELDGQRRPGLLRTQSRECQEVGPNSTGVLRHCLDRLLNPRFRLTRNQNYFVKAASLVLESRITTTPAGGKSNKWVCGTGEHMACPVC